MTDAEWRKFGEINPSAFPGILQATSHIQREREWDALVASSRAFLEEASGSGAAARPTSSSDRLDEEGREVASRKFRQQACQDPSSPIENEHEFLNADFARRHAEILPRSLPVSIADLVSADIDAGCWTDFMTPQLRMLLRNTGKPPGRDDQTRIWRKMQALSLQDAIEGPSTRDFKPQSPSHERLERVVSLAQRLDSIGSAFSDDFRPELPLEPRLLDAGRQLMSVSLTLGDYSVFTTAQILDRSQPADSAESPVGTGRISTSPAGEHDQQEAETGSFRRTVTSSITSAANTIRSTLPLLSP